MAAAWKIGIGLGMAAALGACSPEALTGGKTAAPGCGAGASGVVVSRAWVRAVADDRPMSAAYLTLCNAGAADDQLVAATSPAVATVEIHESTQTPQGVVGMRPVKSVALPKGQPVALAPGGTHLMLIGLLGPLTSGGVMPLTLEFSSGKKITVDAEVRDGAANAPEHEH